MPAPCPGRTRRHANSKGSGEPMRRRMMKSKIHRATVTGANLNYVGSVSIDTELMALADLLPYEQVAVLAIDDGARSEPSVRRGVHGDGRNRVIDEASPRLDAELAPLTEPA